MAWWSRALAVVTAVGSAALAAPVGCGGSDRPPTLADPSGSGGDDASTGLFGDAGPTAPSCTVGVEGGVCACADQPLDVDPPNLYFVLDRSGSMADFGKWQTVQGVLGQLVVELGPRARFAAAVFPDPSQDGCAPGKEVFPLTQGDSPAGVTGPIEFAFVKTLGHIAAAGGTPTAATLTELAAHIESLPGKTFVIFATDGGPNCNASASCTAAQCTDNIENVSGCPAGGPPDCCTDVALGGPVACLDSQPTLDAVSALAAANVPVYVVGVPESEPYAALLDQLAVAGGTARGSEPQYYAIATPMADDFLSTMSKVAAKITGTCTLTLGNAPPDATLVNVFFDGKPIPQAGPDGWTLDGAIVTVLGASCQEILDGDVLDVRVVAGCPTVTL